MADVFDMQECVSSNLAQIEKNDPEVLARPIGTDPVTGPEGVAALLTFLPPESREGALKGFVMAMLCD